MTDTNTPPAAEELGPVDDRLTEAGYVRPTVEVFVAAGPQYKAENYASFFKNYEAEILPNVISGKVKFNRDFEEDDEEQEAPPAPTPAPSPPAPPKAKKTRPSMVYPGYLEEVDE